jgi:hypothetical protein
MPGKAAAVVGEPSGRSEAGGRSPWRSEGSKRPSMITNQVTLVSELMSSMSPGASVPHGAGVQCRAACLR